jgi:acetyltransferase-like isoleucine patch superfamily enzyme
MPIKKSIIHKSVKIFNKNLVNLYGCKIGAGTKIGPFVEIQNETSIGKNCKISSHSFICSGVTIDDNVFIGHNVTFINDRHPKSVNKDGKLKKEKDWVLEKTLVDKGASIGSGSIIMCGIKIGKNSTVGAGSLVLKNIPNNKIFFNKRKEYLKK